MGVSKRRCDLAVYEMEKCVQDIAEKLNITTEAVTKRLISLSTSIARSSNWLVVVFCVITLPDQTQLNSTGCRNSEPVQTDATDKKNWTISVELSPKSDHIARRED